MNNSPRVLFFDIETSLQPVAVFQLAHNDWIDPSSILGERYIICASWLWEGEKKVRSVSVTDDPERFAKDPYDDRHVVEKLHEVLSEADLLIGHNSDNFDKKYIDTRILYHGLSCLPPIPSVDTYKVAKSKLLFNSNKLNYIGTFLKLGKKISTTPGLWMRVLNGDMEAVKEMVRYNKQDVVLLEKVFRKLLPYIPNYLSRELFGGTGCPRCGSAKIQSRGVQRAITRTYQRFQCKTCSGWFRLLKTDKGSATTHRVI